MKFNLWWWWWSQWWWELPPHQSSPPPLLLPPMTRPPPTPPQLQTDSNWSNLPPLKMKLYFSKPSLSFVCLCHFVECSVILGFCDKQFLENFSTNYPPQFFNKIINKEDKFPWQHIFMLQYILISLIKLFRNNCLIK